MAYDKQTWVSGEVITAAKLNHMEDGIATAGSGGGGGAEVFNFDSIVNTQTWTINGSDIEQLIADRPFAIKTKLTNDYNAERNMYLVEFFPDGYGEGNHYLTYSALGSTESFNNGFTAIALHDSVLISYNIDPDTPDISIEFTYDSGTDKYVRSQP